MSFSSTSIKKSNIFEIVFVSICKSKPCLKILKIFLVCQNIFPGRLRCCLCSSGFQSHKNPIENTGASCNFVFSIFFYLLEEGKVPVSPFEKMHMHAYIPSHKINCCNFNFYWRAQNSKTCSVEHSIFVYQARLIIQLTLQMLYGFLLSSPVLEHLQTQQWNLDGLTFGVSATIMVLAYGRDLCVWDSLVRRYGGANITPTSLLRMSGQPPGCPREVGKCFRVSVVCPTLLATDKAALEKQEYVGFP